MNKISSDAAFKSVTVLAKSIGKELDSNMNNWSLRIRCHFKVCKNTSYIMNTKLDNEMNYSCLNISLQWRHNGRGGVWNHRCLDYLLGRLFRRRSKKTSKPRVTGLCEGNSPVTGEFPAQRANNAENVSIRCRHHAIFQILYFIYFLIAGMYATGRSVEVVCYLFVISTTPCP